MHSLEIFELFEYFRVDPEAGLSQAEADRRGERWGLNELVGSGPRRAWPAAHRFAFVWVGVPIVSAALCFAAREWAAGAILLLIALANLWLSLRLAEPPADPLPALRNLVPGTARVRRNNRLQEIESCRLVPGDVISLEAGDTVPADARLFESVNFRVRETNITGKDCIVEKVPQALSDKPLPIGDRTNLVFMGSTVLQGRGRAVVIQTGMRTELGQIAGEILASGRQNSPFQAWLQRAGPALGLGSLAGAGDGSWAGSLARYGPGRSAAGGSRFPPGHFPGRAACGSGRPPGVWSPALDPQPGCRSPASRHRHARSSQLRSHRPHPDPDETPLGCPVGGCSRKPERNRAGAGSRPAGPANRGSPGSPVRGRLTPFSSR